TEKLFSLVIEAVISIRRAKANIELANKKIEHAVIKIDNAKKLESIKKYIELLAKVNEITFSDTSVENAVSDVSENLEVFIPLEGVDLSPIIKRLENQKAKIEKEVAKLTGMLSNEKFLQNAPKKVVEENKETLEKAKENLRKINEKLESF
ncbi:MAG: valine--tRNA ligase, partial [Epsilonproteobacteria bacterium]|nr:valine--tRNA ligase [Campylobacterota bacterium]